MKFWKRHGESIAYLVLLCFVYFTLFGCMKSSYPPLYPEEQQKADAERRAQIFGLLNQEGETMPYQEERVKEDDLSSTDASLTSPPRKEYSTSAPVKRKSAQQKLQKQGQRSTKSGNDNPCTNTHAYASKDRPVEFEVNIERDEDGNVTNYSQKGAGCFKEEKDDTAKYWVIVLLILGAITGIVCGLKCGGGDDNGGGDSKTTIIKEVLSGPAGKKGN